MSFQQGLSGLSTAGKTLDVVGNNIANASTVGFKGAQAQFADVYAASLSGASAANIGLGAKLATVAQQFTQGNISTTNNAMDVAINGGGFYMVSDGGANYYTRNGQFQVDANGYMVTSTGMNLQGIPLDATTGAQAGTLSSIQLFNPNAASDSPAQATGKSASATGVIMGLNLDPRESVPTTIPFNVNTTSSYNQSTAITTYDSLGNAHSYTLYFVKQDTTNAADQLTGVNGLINTWNVYASITNPSGSSTGSTVQSLGPLGTLTFNTKGVVTASLGSDGATATATPGVLPATITAAQLGYPAGVDPLTFNVNFTSSTQYGSNFTINTSSQDGYSSGKLSGFNIGADGVIKGNYTNGQTQYLYQVQLASFRNPQGLQSQGGNVWSETANSGAATRGFPGDSGSYGPLQSSATEDSNVDITQELIAMITAQRVYQANSQTIKTQDQILQTLVNLR